jgi:hypothetical protein
MTRLLPAVVVVCLVAPLGAAPVMALPASAPAIGLDELAAMYKSELGDLFKPELTDRVRQAHEHIERYFAATSRQDRAAAVQALEASGLNPNLLGRLTRLRMHWPALEGGVYYINEKIGPHQVMYFLGIPKAYDRSRPWPLVVKLPASDALFADPPPDGQRVADMYAGWLKDEIARHPDVITLMPRLNLGELYGPSQAGMNTVIQPILHVAGKVNIDPARLYLHGHSLAAHAVWNLALNYTTHFAAINPLAGSAHADWQRLRSMNLRNTTAIVWHDADDKAVPVAEARDLVRILKSFGCPVDYEETKLIGHVPSAAIADRAYDKMLKAARDLYPPQLALQSNRPETMFNRVDWLQVYQPMRTGAEKRLRFAKGSGHMTVYEYTFRATVRTASPNHVEVLTDNVLALRLYFNDRLVDLDKPVTVKINNRVRHEGLLKPSIDEMLKDQVFLGRGWRYFTAVLDIDILEPARPATTSSSRPATRKGVIEVYPAPGSDDKVRRIETP